MKTVKELINYIIEPFNNVDGISYPSLRIYSDGSGTIVLNININKHNETKVYDILSFNDIDKNYKEIYNEIIEWIKYYNIFKSLNPKDIIKAREFATSNSAVYEIISTINSNGNRINNIDNIFVIRNVITNRIYEYDNIFNRTIFKSIEIILKTEEINI